MNGLEAKRRTLTRRLADFGSIVVAYSGGVDSTFLAATAHEVLGPHALAVTALSPSLAGAEATSARALAADRGWRHLEVDTNELQRAGYVANGADRCYWCKTELLEVLRPIASDLGAPIALGTNVDDLSDHRPGLVAAREHEAVAPLADAGLTKAEIRELSARLGLPTSEKPAGPCLASRIAYGVQVTEDRLRRIERAEDFLRTLGFTEFRVRDHGELARIEVPVARIDEVTAARAEIARHLTDLGFRYVTVDLLGFRSGSMNEVLASPTLRRGD